VINAILLKRLHSTVTVHSVKSIFFVFQMLMRQFLRLQSILLKLLQLPPQLLLRMDELGATAVGGIVAEAIVAEAIVAEEIGVVAIVGIAVVADCNRIQSCKVGKACKVKKRNVIKLLRNLIKLTC